MAEEAKTYTYTVILLKDPEEGGYTVVVPALPGCVTEGESVDEALAMAREALEAYVESLLLDGEPVPEERRPLTFDPDESVEGLIYRVTARPEVPVHA
jgi:predicted RNase H-like HicB family nuclease